MIARRSWRLTHRAVTTEAGMSASLVSYHFGRITFPADMTPRVNRVVFKFYS